MKFKLFLFKFVWAWEGISYAFKTQKNMRVHLFFAFTIIILACLFKFSLLKIALIFFAITLVMMAELFNTAIEKCVDVVKGSVFHPTVKIIKDIAAGAVLLSSLNAFLVGIILTLHQMEKDFFVAGISEKAYVLLTFGGIALSIIFFLGFLISKEKRVSFSLRAAGLGLVIFLLIFTSLSLAERELNFPRGKLSPATEVALGGLSLEDKIARVLCQSRPILH